MFQFIYNTHFIFYTSFLSHVFSIKKLVEIRCYHTLNHQPPTNQPKLLIAWIHVGNEILHWKSEILNPFSDFKFAFGGNLAGP